MLFAMTFPAEPRLNPTTQMAMASLLLAVWLQALFLSTRHLASILCYGILIDRTNHLWPNIR